MANNARGTEDAAPAAGRAPRFRGTEFSTPIGEPSTAEGIVVVVVVVADVVVVGAGDTV